jgi:hypothetical protein
MLTPARCVFRPWLDRSVCFISAKRIAHVARHQVAQLLPFHDRRLVVSFRLADQ